MTTGYAGGYTFTYDEAENNITEGVRYLTGVLANDEAIVPFVCAYQKGNAPFQDNYGRKFDLLYKGSEYILTSRS